MVPNKASEKACSECWGLKNGTRSNQDPHEYLVPSPSVETGTPATYKCLLCQAELTRTDEGSMTFWR